MTAQWIVSGNFSASQVQAFAEKLRVPEAIARILLNRGVDSFDKAKSFFRPEITLLHNPFLLLDMDVAVDRIQKAIRNKENIVLYGDYDVDGTTSVAMLFLFLKQLEANLKYYIPDRMKDGYGLSCEAIHEIKNWGTNLIITTDCGITACDEIDLVNQLGMDIIVTDHHEPSEKLPNAAAILNPKRMDCNYPFKELAGVGVAFKLIQGISQAMNLDDESFLQHLDLVAIGSAADIVQLIGENRILVRAGLARLNKTDKIGIRALLASSGLHSKTINSGQIVFVLAPRINAVGRMGSANRAVHLFIADSHQKARNIAAILEAENRNRRNIDEETFNQAQELMNEEYDPEQHRMIVLAREGWHPGVIGIVASRIVEKYYRPTVMISLENGAGKGSARSIPGFDIYQALKSCKKYMLGFGGHKYAAGLSIRSDQVPFLQTQLNQYAWDNMIEDDLVPKITIDSPLQLNEVDERFVRILNMFAPYGPHNMRPIFMSSSLEVVGTPQIVGSNHLKFKVRQNSVVIDSIGFNMGDYLYRIEPGKKNLDMVYLIDENEYLGRKTLQLRVKDLR